MQLAHLLDKMRLEYLSAQIDSVCEQAAKRELDYKAFLVEALAAEWRGRHSKGIEIRLAQARLPWIKTLEQFDFGFQPSLDRTVIRELAGLSFVERADNVILLGPPGGERPTWPWRWASKRSRPAIACCFHARNADQPAQTRAR